MNAKKNYMSNVKLTNFVASLECMNFNEWLSLSTIQFERKVP